MISVEEVNKIIDKLTNPKSGLTTSLEEDALVIINKMNRELAELNENIRLLKEELNIVTDTPESDGEY